MPNYGQLLQFNNWLQDRLELFDTKQAELDQKIIGRIDTLNRRNDPWSPYANKNFLVDDTTKTK